MAVSRISAVCGSGVDDAEGCSLYRETSQLPTGLVLSNENGSAVGQVSSRALLGDYLAKEHPRLPRDLDALSRRGQLRTSSSNEVARITDFAIIRGGSVLSAGLQIFRLGSSYWPINLIFNGDKTKFPRGLRTTCTYLKNHIHTRRISKDQRKHIFEFFEVPRAKKKNKKHNNIAVTHPQQTSNR